MQCLAHDLNGVMLFEHRCFNDEIGLLFESYNQTVFE